MVSRWRLLLYSFILGILFLGGNSRNTLAAPLASAHPDLSIVIYLDGGQTHFTTGQQVRFNLSICNAREASPTIGLVTAVQILPKGLSHIRAEGAGWRTSFKKSQGRTDLIAKYIGLPLQNDTCVGTIAVYAQIDRNAVPLHKKVQTLTTTAMVWTSGETALKDNSARQAIMVSLSPSSRKR